MLTTAFFVPSFSSFHYYFMMDVVEVSKFTIAMLGLLGSLGTIIGIYMYQRWFLDWDFRTLVLIDVVVELLAAPLKFMFVFRLNTGWGIPDLPLVIVFKGLTDIASQCLLFLPFTVITAKICPKRIEATGFALLASISAFRGNISSWIGSYINDKFVGVTQDNLQDYWMLGVINFCCGAIPLAFLWLIPTQKEVSDLQKEMTA